MQATESTHYDHKSCWSKINVNHCFAVAVTTYTHDAGLDVVT